MGKKNQTDVEALLVSLRKEIGKDILVTLAVRSNEIIFVDCHDYHSKVFLDTKDDDDETVNEVKNESVSDRPSYLG